jgi:hypothetical protein
MQDESDDAQSGSVPPRDRRANFNAIIRREYRLNQLRFANRCSAGNLCRRIRRWFGRDFTGDFTEFSSEAATATKSTTAAVGKSRCVA